MRAFYACLALLITSMLSTPAAQAECGEVTFQCPYGYGSYSVPTHDESSFWNPIESCEFEGDQATTAMFEHCEVPCCDDWPKRINGCSVPSIAVGVKAFANAEFIPACNLHDLCYSSPGANKSNCDSELLENMKAICSTRFNAYPLEEELCDEYAEIIHTAVDKFAQSAFDDDQAYVRKSCSTTRASTLGEPLVYGDEVSIKMLGTDLRLRMPAGSTKAFFSSGAEAATKLYIRPTAQSEGCVREGDRVYLAHTPNEKPNQCGPWGCRVLGLTTSSASDRTLSFKHGTDATPLYISTGGSKSPGQCLLKELDLVVLMATPYPSTNSTCGVFGCRVMQYRRSDYRAVLDHTTRTGLDNSGFLWLQIGSYEGCTDN